MPEASTIMDSFTLQEARGGEIRNVRVQYIDHDATLQPYF